MSVRSSNVGWFRPDAGRFGERRIGLRTFGRNRAFGRCRPRSGRHQRNSSRSQPEVAGSNHKIWADLPRGFVGSSPTLIEPSAVGRREPFLLARRPKCSYFALNSANRQQIGRARCGSGRTTAGQSHFRVCTNEHALVCALEFLEDCVATKFRIQLHTHAVIM